MRAETCDHCHSYRKILYLEKDPSLEPVADDLGTLALDILLGEEGYARASTKTAASDTGLKFLAIFPFMAEHFHHV